MKRALFLDRDGVINHDTNYAYRPHEMIFVDGIFDLCRRAQDLEYLLIVVTNQAGIGRGYYTEQEFHDLTHWIDQQFSDQGIVLAETYFCPDHPEHGLGAYKKESFDRKPNPGMLLRAAQKYDLSPALSLMIGDRETDMQAAQAAGVGKKILLCSQKPEKTVADFWVTGLGQVVPLLLG